MRDFPEFKEVIKMYRLRKLPKMYQELLQRNHLQWGSKITPPKLLVGTIHSAKGLEADVVILDTTVSNLGREILDGLHGHNNKHGEIRVWYVGVTRHREKLIITGEDEFNLFGMMNGGAR